MISVSNQSKQQLRFLERLHVLASFKEWVCLIEVMICIRSTKRHLACSARTLLFHRLAEMVVQYC